MKYQHEKFAAVRSATARMSVHAEAIAVLKIAFLLSDIERLIVRIH